MTDILLATYNGERFLRQQLDSLLAQTEQDFRISVLDDASTDGTPAVLADYSARFPGKMEVRSVRQHTGDPARNFFALLAGSTGDYVMLCDQDDVWKPDKIRASLQIMHEQEEKTPDRPVLVHTDLEVVGEDLHRISPSFFAYQRLEPSFSSLPRLVVQNNVTGCTILMNHCLRERVRVPASIFMHDWWLALTASAFGTVVCLREPTVLYRQHQGNVVGASRTHSLSAAADRIRSGSARSSLERTYALARCFQQTYAESLSAVQTEFLDRYAACGEAGLWGRLRTLMQFHAFKKGIGRKLAQILLGGSQHRGVST